ncbi:hypothetical protein BAUCODRAFT_319336 [Baudoinia panamericana UAMH 10762]|uniref:Eukaryotic translation initiation factor 3 subunit J n=1 Tax=Baudoinia panamericana (strain UAMH 10762) TaxID=717646 RepID=M2MJ02_BAUPA|nr:uncharacterized protein BAUCODRAFT_319336 [Baudoinia panamericana UAMH 10762]EMC91253.1 hypothetical protein BAUCODRAFT_319336 [Baudoinia panamericana UAMH 10762]
MGPSKAPSSWDDEDSDSTPPSSPPVIARRGGKFEDEEDEDVLDDWEEGEDSEEEREKAKKAAEAKAKAEAEAKAAHKSKTQRIEERRLQHLKEKEDLFDEDDSEEELTEAERRARAAASEKESDLRHAEDLFGGAGMRPDRPAAPKAVTVPKTDIPGDAIDLSSLSLFQPSTPAQWQQLRETLVPLLSSQAKKPAYALFMVEFAKQLCKELNSEQVKKVAAGLNTMANEKMRDEKAAEKGGKKSKAAKTKTTLNASRDVGRSTAGGAGGVDVNAYDDGGLDDGDFM